MCVWIYVYKKIKEKFTESHLTHVSTHTHTHTIYDMSSSTQMYVHTYTYVLNIWVAPTHTTVTLFAPITTHAPHTSCMLLSNAQYYDIKWKTNIVMCIGCTHNSLIVVVTCLNVFVNFYTPCYVHRTYIRNTRTHKYCTKGSSHWCRSIEKNKNQSVLIRLLFLSVVYTRELRTLRFIIIIIIVQRIWKYKIKIEIYFERFIHFINGLNLLITLPCWMNFIGLNDKRKICLKVSNLKVKTNQQYQ